MKDLEAKAEPEPGRRTRATRSQGRAAAAAAAARRGGGGASSSAAAEAVAGDPAAAAELYCRVMRPLQVGCLLLTLKHHVT